MSDDQSRKGKPMKQQDAAKYRALAGVLECVGLQLSGEQVIGEQGRLIRVIGRMTRRLAIELRSLAETPQKRAKALIDDQSVLVVCQCGYIMRRRPARRDLGETHPCFDWFHRSAPEKLSYCPICGVAPSLLSTQPVKIAGTTADMEGTMGP